MHKNLKMKIDILTEEQYKTLSKRLVNAIEGHYKIIALNTLQSPSYILTKPIYITIEIEEDKVRAELWIWELRDLRINEL